MARIEGALTPCTSSPGPSITRYPHCRYRPSQLYSRATLADCSGKDFPNRRDCAIIRLFLDTGMRLEGMSTRGTERMIPSSPMWISRRAWHVSPLRVAVSWFCPLGQDCTRHRQVLRLRAAHLQVADSWLWLGKRPTDREWRLPDDQGPGSAVGLSDLHPTSYGIRSRMTGWPTAAQRAT